MVFIFGPVVFFIVIGAVTLLRITLRVNTNEN